MKAIDSTNLGYLISKIKAAFWPKSDVVQVNIESTPTANSSNLVTSGGVASALSGKQDTISDLATIRSGAAAGATAVQSSDLATVATTGAYGDLSGTPTIPTKTSDLDNDSGYITDAGVTSFNGATGAVTYSAPVSSVNGQTGAVSLTIPDELSDLAGDATHRTVTDAEKTTWSGKQDALVSGTNLKTINGQSLLGSGNITIEGGSSITVDDALSSSSTNPVQNKVINSALSGKQDTISDLATIRSGAEAGATAYQLPGTGIPASDLASAVQTSLGKADTALQSYTETDPVFSASAAAGITASDISAWDAKYNKPSGGIPKTDLASAVQTSLGKADTAIQSSDLATVATTGAYSDLSGTPSLATVATSGDYDDLTNKPSIPAAQVQSDWNATSGMGVILNKPTLATVATSGAYSDLSGTPSLATVATTGAYSDLSGTPTIPTVPTISTDIQTDKASTTKTAAPSAVYNEVHPAVVSSQPSGGMLPNVPYSLGTLTGSVTFALNTTDVDSSIANHYFWTFETGSTAPTITWPAAITSWFGGSAPTINASKHYEISLLGGVAIAMEA